MCRAGRARDRRLGERAGPPRPRLVELPALPDALVGIAGVSEDWDGVRWYVDPADDPADDGGPLWRRCVPLDPPPPPPRVVADTAPDEDTPVVRWRGWAGDERWCTDEVRGVTDYGDPATFVLAAGDGWNVCSFSSWYADIYRYAGRLKCWNDPDEYSFLHPQTIGRTRAAIEMSDSEDPLRYLPFQTGVGFDEICVTPAENAEPHRAVGAVPGPRHRGAARDDHGRTGNGLTSIDFHQRNRRPPCVH